MMKDPTKTLEWASDCLTSRGYLLEKEPVTIVESPWSKLFRFKTSTGDFYLKQTPPGIPLESTIIQLLSDKCHASVAKVLAVNQDEHCFLMMDGGQTLRTYLQAEFKPDLLCYTARQFTAMQRSTEKYLDAFFAIGVPDWRLCELPSLYENLVQQTTLLKSEGMSEIEIQILKDLLPIISEQCKLLSQYDILETIVQPDFNTNNVLIDLDSQTLTFIDLGEIAITHPFFSLHNYLFQAVKHHGVIEKDQTYHRLQETCLENWLGSFTHKQLSEAFSFSKKLWPIYGALAYHRLMTCVDLQALKAFYADRPSALAVSLKEYIKSC